MDMLKEYPYHLLKQDARSYEIMLLRDQHGNTFADIAKEYQISAASAAQKYHMLKVKQIRLYLNHLSIALEQKDLTQVKNGFAKAYDCYQDLTFACAYLEKKYPDILLEYRCGEPGMPAQFLKSMPPFRAYLRKNTIIRIVEMREMDRASFSEIAQKLHMTPAKAKHTYDWFYHKQVLAIFQETSKKLETQEEKTALWEYCFEKYNTPKKRYEALQKWIGG